MPSEAPTTGYEIVDAPRHAAMISFDCAECGHHELTRPVFLRTGTGATIAVGTGCAEKLTGRPRAQFDADLALARLDELKDQYPHVVGEIWTWYRICRPMRVTAKFISEATDRFRNPDLVTEIATIWTAARKAGRA